MRVEGLRVSLNLNAGVSFSVGCLLWRVTLLEKTSGKEQKKFFCRIEKDHHAFFSN